MDRLTDREKDCLRRRLRHQTAKEMAIDIGVSPHAIEKRLKMARTKLGVASSLEAARLLAEKEDYQGTGPQLSDIDSGWQVNHKFGPQQILLGAFIMSVTIIAFISVFLSNAGDTDQASAIPKPGEILISGPATFDELDKDDSGFLEGKEAPVLMRVGGEATYGRDAEGNITFIGDYVTISNDNVLRDQFYLEADTDQDGKISPSEFIRWAAPKTNKN